MTEGDEPKKESAVRTIIIALVTALLISGISGFFTDWRTIEHLNAEIKVLKKSDADQKTDIAAMKKAQQEQGSKVITAINGMTTGLKVMGVEMKGIRKDLGRVEKNLEDMRRKR